MVFILLVLRKRVVIFFGRFGCLIIYFVFFDIFCWLFLVFLSFVWMIWVLISENFFVSVEYLLRMILRYFLFFRFLINGVFVKMVFNVLFNEVVLFFFWFCFFLFWKNFFKMLLVCWGVIVICFLWVFMIKGFVKSFF